MGMKLLLIMSSGLLAVGCVAPWSQETRVPLSVVPEQYNMRVKWAALQNDYEHFLLGQKGKNPGTVTREEVLELHQLVQAFTALQEKMSKFAARGDNDLRANFIVKLRRLYLNVKENYETGLKLQELEDLTQNSRVTPITKTPPKD